MTTPNAQYSLEVDRSDELADGKWSVVVCLVNVVSFPDTLSANSVTI